MLKALALPRGKAYQKLVLYICTEEDYLAGIFLLNYNHRLLRQKAAKYHIITQKYTHKI